MTWSPEARLADERSVEARFWTTAVDGPRRVLEHRYRFDRGSMRLDLGEQITELEGRAGRDG